MSKAWMVDAKEFEADPEIVKLISLHKQVRDSGPALHTLRTNREDYTAALFCSFTFYPCPLIVPVFV